MNLLQKFLSHGQGFFFKNYCLVARKQLFWNIAICNSLRGMFEFSGRAALKMWVTSWIYESCRSGTPDFFKNVAVETHE
jgi:hypothetical protein